MLEYLFGNKTIEKVLFFTLIHGKCYATGLQKRLQVPLYSIQTALLKLEQGGVLVSFLVGKTRVFQWNPRYPFLAELQAFLKKAYEFIPRDLRTVCYEIVGRQRPRKTGKPL